MFAYVGSFWSLVVIPVKTILRLNLRYVSCCGWRNGDRLTNYITCVSSQVIASACKYWPKGYKCRLITNYYCQKSASTCDFVRPGPKFKQSRQKLTNESQSFGSTTFLIEKMDIIINLWRLNLVHYIPTCQ